MNEKYERVMRALSGGRQPTMKAFGRSMVPLIPSGSKLTYSAEDDYQVGDVVFSKVKGRIIAAHKITKIDARGRYMIANQKNRENGWASKVWGRVIAVDGEPFGRTP